ncbi:unnamed protein product, partial [Brassica napus]
QGFKGFSEVSLNTVIHTTVPSPLLSTLFFSGAMASLMMATPFAGSLTQCKKTKDMSLQRAFKVKCMQTPLEELYNVKVERKVSQRRLDELGVSRWSVWKTGKCKLPWDWQVDQLVY